MNASVSHVSRINDGGTRHAGYRGPVLREIALEFLEQLEDHFIIRFGPNR